MLLVVECNLYEGVVVDCTCSDLIHGKACLHISLIPLCGRPGYKASTYFPHFNTRGSIMYIQPLWDMTSHIQKHKFVPPKYNGIR